MKRDGFFGPKKGGNSICETVQKSFLFELGIGVSGCRLWHFDCTCNSGKYYCDNSVNTVNYRGILLMQF